MGFECLILLIMFGSLVAVIIGIAKLFARRRHKLAPKQQLPIPATKQPASPQAPRQQVSYRIDAVDTSQGIGEDSLLRAIRSGNYDQAEKLAQFPLVVSPSEVTVPTEAGKLRFRLYGYDALNITLHGNRGGIKLAIDVPLDVIAEIIETLLAQRKERN